MTIIPGGKVKFREGETKVRALPREIMEELGEGVNATDIRDLGDFYLISRTGRIHHPCAYLVMSWKGEIINNEPEKGHHRWIAIKDYDSQLQLAASKLVVERALKFIKGG